MTHGNPIVGPFTHVLSDAVPKMRARQGRRRDAFGQHGRGPAPARLHRRQSRLSAQSTRLAGNGVGANQATPVHRSLTLAEDRAPANSQCSARRANPCCSGRPIEATIPIPLLAVRYNRAERLRRQGSMRHFQPNLGPVGPPLDGSRTLTRSGPVLEGAQCCRRNTARLGIRFEDPQDQWSDTICGIGIAAQERQLDRARRLSRPFRPT